MASRVRRWSAPRRPRTGSAGISGSIRSHIASLITNRTDTSDQLTNPSKRHALVRQTLNTHLAAEQLTVTYVSGRPVLGQPGTDGHTTVFTVPDDLEARIRPLVSSEAFLQQLMERVTETQICEQHGAYGLTLIGIGSFAEALLLDVLTHRDPTLLQGFVLPNGKLVPPERTSFSLLLDTARSRGWIQMDAHDFMKIVRDYRNFVHLRQQQERGVTPDRDTVGMCWGPVLAVLNDLETSR